MYVLLFMYVTLFQWPCLIIQAVQLSLTNLVMVTVGVQVTADLAALAVNELSLNAELEFRHS